MCMSVGAALGPCHVFLRKRGRLFQYPGKKSAKNYQIPAKLRVKLWFGQKQYEHQWQKAQTENVVVMAETVSA